MGLINTGKPALVMPKHPMYHGLHRSLNSRRPSGIYRTGFMHHSCQRTAASPRVFAYWGIHMVNMGWQTVLPIPRENL